MAEGFERNLSEIQASFAREREAVRDVAGLEALHTRYLGRKQGVLTQALRDVPKLPVAERPAAGQGLNRLKQTLEAALEALALEIKERAAPRAAVDLTLPDRRPQRGTTHPLSLVEREIESIFAELGYAVATGPEVDDDFHNFEALNIPRDHPARDMQDTLYVSPDVLLRSHTSNVQVHTMEAQKPPIRVIAPGRVFRRDTPDLTHSPVFHQVEGLLVDEGIHLGHLKGTLDHFSRRFFGPSTRTRLRPSFFSFTEPSAELDISCVSCAGAGCAVCKHSGWVEILGCGMVDPNVFAMLHIDSERYTGFAFGMGVERAAMLKYGIDDIRLLYDNDLRFLDQFRAWP